MYCAIEANRRGETGGRKGGVRGRCGVAAGNNTTEREFNYCLGGRGFAFP